VTDRKSIERALRQAEDLKDEFIALAAHELRNPMAALKARVQLSREAVLDAIRRGDLRAHKVGNRGGWRIRPADYEARLGSVSNDQAVMKTAGEIDEANRVFWEADRKWKSGGPAQSSSEAQQ
jgi:signal transduction histidine kinase